MAKKIILEGQAAPLPSNQVYVKSGDKLNQTNNIPEVTVYGKNQYLQELDKQQQKYLADMAKYKQDSAQWVKANQAYQDSLGLYNTNQKYIKEISDYYDTTPEEVIKEYSNTYNTSPTSDKVDIDLFMKPNRYVNDWSAALRDEAIRTGNRPTHIFPPGEYVFTNFPLFKKPIVEPQRPLKTTTAKNVNYDSTYEHLNMRSLWPEMVKQDTTAKIGTLHPLDPLFNKGFTYGEAQKFPEEIKKKYKLDYPIKFQTGGQITAKDRLKQHYKNQANKGKQAVTSGTNKFAKNYMLPAAKIAGSVTPIGPVIGLMDAKEAYDSGNTGWAMFGAGMEALPYIGKGVSKGINILKNIPGIGKDAPELGYHALNKNHWAFNPRKLYKERANSNELLEESATIFDKIKHRLRIDKSAAVDVGTLYGLAAANRTINLLKKTPLNNMIKDNAERVMRISSSSSRSPSQILKNKTHSYTPYKGSFAEDMVASGDLRSQFAGQERDLINLYLRGDTSGFEEISNNMKTINFGERYNKLYPNAKYYVMQSKLPNNTPISLGNMPDNGFISISETSDNGFVRQAVKDKRKATKSFAYASYVDPIDDISGHQVQVRGDLEKPILITQDLWKFNPKDYTKRWAVDEQGVARDYSKLLFQKQAGLLDKVGNPFYLVQNNPIIP